MKRNLHILALLTLLAGSMNSTAALAAEKAPRFNGPFHQDRNPNARQPNGNAPGVVVVPVPRPGFAPCYPQAQFPYDPTWAADQTAPYPDVAASTAAAAELQGQAEFLRGMGKYNLNTSEAMINAEQAHSAHLDNSKKKAEVFYEKRRIHDETLAAERDRRAAKAAANRAAKPVEPVRSPAQPLPCIAGRLTWPVGLSGTEFQADRQVIAGLMGAHGMSQQAQNQVQQLAGDMQVRLLDQLHHHQVKPMDYVAAKKFLTSLESAAGVEVTVAGLAQR